MLSRPLLISKITKPIHQDRSRRVMLDHRVPILAPLHVQHLPRVRNREAKHMGMHGMCPTLQAIGPARGQVHHRRMRRQAEHRELRCARK